MLRGCCSHRREWPRRPGTLCPPGPSPSPKPAGEDLQTPHAREHRTEHQHGQARGCCTEELRFRPVEGGQGRAGVDGIHQGVDQGRRCVALSCTGCEILLGKTAAAPTGSAGVAPRSCGRRTCAVGSGCFRFLCGTIFAPAISAIAWAAAEPLAWPEPLGAIAASRGPGGGWFRRSGQLGSDHHTNSGRFTRGQVRGVGCYRAQTITPPPADSPEGRSAALDATGSRYRPLVAAYKRKSACARRTRLLSLGRRQAASDHRAPRLCQHTARVGSRRSRHHDVG